MEDFGNGLTSSFEVCVCKDAEDATKKRHVYHGYYTHLKIERVVVVKDGTEAHKPTVDIVMYDKEGNKFVAILTGRLLRAIPCQ